MIRATQLLERQLPEKQHPGIAVQILELVLTYDQRKRGRLRATSTCGQEVGLFLERGRTLCDGDILSAGPNTHVRIKAANEHVSCAQTTDTLLLTRAAYHLGNRHVPLQISADTLVYQHDHVLDDMVRGLGLSVSTAMQPFHPESGAYHSHAAGALAPLAAHGNVFAISSVHHEHAHHE